MISLGIDIGGTSVKSALLDDDAARATGRSAPYARPRRDALVRAIRDTTRRFAGKIDAVGLCLPGVYDAARGAISESVHLPALVGVPVRDVVADAMGYAPQTLVVVSDQIAAAHDLYFTRKLSGRLLSIAIGTGVGAAVLNDGGEPLRVNGDSPGHLGQIDVTLGDDPPIGPDGGAGGLEAYLSAGALQRAYGPDVPAAVANMTAVDPPMRALARAIRICHAIYRPDHVILAGGIGIHLGHVLPGLRSKIERNLTRLARPGWTLSIGHDDFHAARGAARLAVK